MRDVNTPIERRLTDLILEQHKTCREVPTEHFVEATLDRVHALIPFDSAVWGAGVLMPHGPQIYNVFKRGVDDAYVAALNSAFHLDKHARLMFEQAGTTFVRDGHDPQDADVEFRRIVLDPVGLRYSMITCVADRASGIFNGVALNRHASSPRFTDQERAMKEALMPHLYQTFAANQIERAMDVLDSGLRASYYSIVCTRDGLLVAMHDAALRLLTHQWPAWAGSVLPDELLRLAAAAARGRPAMAQFGDTLVARAVASENQLLLRVRAPTIIDRLGQREREIAEHYATGRSHKQIAQSLGLSPSTVSNQLAVVYEKLNISSKAELSSLLERLN